MSRFRLDLLKAYWVDGSVDNPSDYCLHGTISAWIDDKIIIDEYECTVSSAALYLLKAIESNHVRNQESSFLFPCCGNLILVDKNDNNNAITIGCSNGIDWGITHIEDKVKIEYEEDVFATLLLNEFRGVVFGFVDKVIKFYGNSSTKEPLEHEDEQLGYKVFWEEIRRRRFS